jgi:hypothetical protein
MAGLAAATPLVAIAAGAPPGARAAAAGLLVFAYYASSLSLVRAYRRRGDASAAAWCLAAQILLTACLIPLSLEGWLPPVALLAFVPVVGRGLWVLDIPAPSVRTLGFHELAVATTFLAIAVTVPAALPARLLRRTSEQSRLWAWRDQWTFTRP